jgi:hypothetical protein
MDEDSHKIPQLSFFFVLFFGMGTGLGISYKFKSPFTCENLHFDFSLFAPPFDSPSFLSLEKIENALLLTNHLVKILKTNHVNSKTGKKWGSCNNIFNL